MKYTFKITINNEVSKLHRIIIEKYWLFNGIEFENMPSLLLKEFNVSQHELNKIISENSDFEINKGFCTECGVELIFKERTQTQIKNVIDKTVLQCDLCRVKINKKLKIERELSQVSRKEQQLQEALKYKRWEELEPNELMILKKIIEVKDRDLIFRDIFSLDYVGTWKVVNRLESIGLLCVKKNDNNNVIDFSFLRELEDTIMSKDKKSEIKLEIKNDISFLLSKKVNKTISSQPDYSGVFVLPTDIILKKDVEYIYGGWIQSDGSINFKFTPKEEYLKGKDDLIYQNDEISSNINKIYDDCDFDEDLPNICDEEVPY